MPRSVDEILAQADELAERFALYEPSPEDEIDIDLLQGLRAAAAEKAAAERHLVEAIRLARKRGMAWSSIGSITGTTGEAARQRYRHLCEI